MYRLFWCKSDANLREHGKHESLLKVRLLVLEVSSDLVFLLY
ncbi:unnamed protein product [Amoebophrya sp. A25]|nr:unnamed protein product [Amoebophrya sp. A25]|eukprot:GSA25T00016544001.1